MLRKNAHLENMVLGSRRDHQLLLQGLSQFVHLTGFQGDLLLLKLPSYHLGTVLKRDLEGQRETPAPDWFSRGLVTPTKQKCLSHNQCSIITRNGAHEVLILVVSEESNKHTSATKKDITAHGKIQMVVQ